MHLEISSFGDRLSSGQIHFCKCCRAITPLLKEHPGRALLFYLCDVKKRNLRPLTLPTPRLRTTVQPSQLPAHPISTSIPAHSKPQQRHVLHETTHLLPLLESARRVNVHPPCFPTISLKLAMHSPFS